MTGKVKEKRVNSFVMPVLCVDYVLTMYMYNNALLSSEHHHCFIELKFAINSIMN